MKYLFAVLSVFLLPASLLAQTFYPGYLVTNNGDTLKGYVKLRETVLNPKNAEFKVEPNDNPRIYPVNEVSYFSIDVGYPLDFKRYTGPVSMDDININRVTTLRDTSFKIDTIFLKILHKDNHVTLYSYDDNLKTRFFVSDGQSAPVELVYRIYLKDDTNNGKNTVNENTYKKQLIALAVKYGKMDSNLQALLDRTDYREMYLDQVVDKINGYTGPDLTKGNYVASPPKAKLFIMVAAVVVVAYLVFHK